MDNRFQMQLLGGDQGEPLLQIEAHLVTKNRACAGPGAVGLGGAMFVDMAHEVEVGAHGEKFF